MLNGTLAGLQVLCGLPVHIDVEALDLEARNLDEMTQTGNGDRLAPKAAGPLLQPITVKNHCMRCHPAHSETANKVCTRFCEEGSLVECDGYSGDHEYRA
jgi:hypothetical protein